MKLNLIRISNESYKFFLVELILILFNILIHKQISVFSADVLKINQLIFFSFPSQFFVNFECCDYLKKDIVVDNVMIINLLIFMIGYLIGYDIYA